MFEAQGHDISKASIRRLARRGGVKRMGRGAYGEGRTALIAFLQPIVRDVVLLAEHGRRFTVKVTDVLLVLKRNGHALFGFGEVLPNSQEHAARLRRRPTAAARQAAAQALAAEERDGGGADVNAEDLPDTVFDPLQNALSVFRYSPDNRFRDVFKVDELVEGAAAQLTGDQRAMCMRRALLHVLLALEDNREVIVDGDNVYF